MKSQHMQRSFWSQYYYIVCIASYKLLGAPMIIWSFYFTCLISIKIFHSHCARIKLFYSTRVSMNLFILRIITELFYSSDYLTLSFSNGLTNAKLFYSSVYHFFIPFHLSWLSYSIWLFNDKFLHLFRTVIQLSYN